MTLYQSYQAYRTWNEARDAAGQPRVFPQIPSDHFLAYLKNCIPDITIGQIFKYAERIVWDPQKKEELARLDRLIDSCISGAASGQPETASAAGGTAGRPIRRHVPLQADTGPPA